MWQESLVFRRIVAGTTLLLAALLVYLGANIPQAVSLPNDDVNKRAVAHFGEELRIYKPKLDEEDAALSYAGAPNETAEVWADHASLTGPSRVLLAGAAPDGISSIVYSAADASQTVGDKQCRTTVIVRRAQGSPPAQTLELAQRDPGYGDQQFRQILFRSPSTAMQVEIHTDSEVAGEEGLTQCPRSVKIGDSTITLPGGPLYLLVPPQGWINLRFVSTDPNHPAWPDNDSTLNSVSLGDDGLEASGVDVISTKTAKSPLLHVQSHRGTDEITLHGLKIAAQAIRLEVGTDTEKADAAASGKPITVLNLPDLIQKNPILSFLFAAVLIPALWKWVAKVCFPGKSGDPVKE